MNYLLFDNDGVLVNTEHLYYEANRQVLADAGFFLSEASFAKISLKQGECVIRSTFTSCPDTHLREMKTQRDRLYNELLQTEPVTIPGVEDQLNRLKQYFRLAVVTSSQAEHFATIHRQTNLQPFFDFVLTREDYKRSKPSPEPYLTAVKRFGAAPEDCLVVEDTPRGQAAATAAGINCVIIPNRLLKTSDFASDSRFVRDLSTLVEFCIKRATVK